MVSKRIQNHKQLIRRHQHWNYHNPNEFKVDRKIVA